MKQTYKFLGINVLIVGLIVMGLLFGIIQNFFTHDISHLTYVISGIMAFNVVISLYDAYMYDTNDLYTFKRNWIEGWINFIKDRFLFIGLAGTLVGFFSLMQGLLLLTAAGTGQAAISDLISHIVIACQTIFAPTLLGILAKLWTDLNLYVLSEE